MELDGVQLDTISQCHDLPSPMASDLNTNLPTLPTQSLAILIKAAQEPTALGPQKTPQESLRPTPSTLTLAIATKASPVLSPSTPDSMITDSPPPSPPAHAIFDLPASPTLLRGSVPPGSPVSAEEPNGVPTTLLGPLPLASHTPAQTPVATEVSVVSTVAKASQVLKKRKVVEDGVGSSGKNGDNTNGHRHSKKAIQGKRNGILVPVPVFPQVPVASTTCKSSRAHTVTMPAIPASTVMPAPADIVSAPTASSASTLVINKPAWFTAAVSMMEGEKGLGVMWVKLVDAWVVFEGQAGYTGDKKLLTTHRPDAIKAWIARTRSSTWRPAISDTSLYESEFMLWWAALQPSWRKRSDGGIIFSKVQGDWEVLQRPGLNGILSVMAGLLFWGVSLRDSSGSRMGWNKAVSDCLVVMKSITL